MFQLRQEDLQLLQDRICFFDASTLAVSLDALGFLDNSFKSFVNALSLLFVVKHGILLHQILSEWVIRRVFDKRKPPKNFRS
nr:MAG TPA_asm: hypothetical protein [Caudoviricetes sp.]